MIRIHKEGRVIVGLTILFLLLFVVVSALFLSLLWNYLSSALTLALLILVFRFFRVPGRKALLNDRMVTAPADGRVVAIEKVTQDEFMGGPCIQVSVFMSIHDVHINYYPVGGTISYLKYHPGNYLVARHPKSSVRNERFSIGIENPQARILVIQVAGFVARRIRCYAREGTSAKQGDELGFIKFGSRLDLFLPPDVTLHVALNDRVTGSVSPIASFKK